MRGIGEVRGFVPVCGTDPIPCPATPAKGISEKGKDKQAKDDFIESETHDKTKYPELNPLFKRKTAEKESVTA